MKKIMALLCTVAMSVGLLAGCGSSSGDNQSVSGSDNTGNGGKVVMLACEPEVPQRKKHGKKWLLISRKKPVFR